MKYQKHLLAVASLAALALCGPFSAPSHAKPKATPTPAATSEASAKPARSIPFRGTVSAMDKSAKTFAIAGKTASRTFMVTDKSTVTKAGAPSTFADLTDGEAVTGSYWKHEDGKLEVRSLKIGGKTDAEKAAAGKKSSKKKKSGDTEPSSPAPKE